MEQQRSTSEISRDQQSLISLIETAVTAALEHQERVFNTKLNEITRKLQTLPSPEIEQYEEMDIDECIRCDEPLDIIKSIPKFDGKQINEGNFHQGGSPHFTKKQGYVNHNHQRDTGSSRQKPKDLLTYKGHEPMEVDPSMSKFRQPTNFRSVKSSQSRQGLNHITQGIESDYQDNDN